MIDELTISASRLLIALFAGGLIGLERAFHGRPAGLRTHALVCTASSLLMLFTVYQWDLLTGAPMDTIRIDPTRMAQGIMTGIGFLGAGVIMQEKLSIRGLTTAASIWITAAIGILMGMGFYTAGILATVLTLIILSLFGWVERCLPTRRFATLMIRMKAEQLMSREEINQLITNFNIHGWHPSYRLSGKDRMMEYKLTVYSNNSSNFQQLANALTSMKQVAGFHILPTGD